MARFPQREHSSMWPPSAEVRHETMAVKIFRCSQVNLLPQGPGNLESAGRGRPGNLGHPRANQLYEHVGTRGPRHLFYGAQNSRAPNDTENVPLRVGSKQPDGSAGSAVPWLGHAIESSC